MSKVLPKNLRALGQEARLSARDVEKIFGAVVGKEGALDHTRRRRLASITEELGARYDASAARRWLALTGLSVKATASATSAGLTATELRASVGLHTKHLERVEGLSPKQLEKLALPSTCLETFLSEGAPSRAVEHVLEELRALERDHGDNDGVLAPRDLDLASGAARALMDVVYRDKGARSLTLASLEPELRRAMVALFRFPGWRKDARFQPLFVKLAKDALSAMAVDYDDRVIRGTMTQRRFLARYGIATPVQRARLHKAVPDLLRKPTLDELSALHARMAAGKLGFREFYVIAKMTSPEFEALAKKHPTLFDLSASGKVNGTAVEARTLRDIARLWREGRSRTEIGQQLGLAVVDLKRIEKKNPELFQAKQLSRAQKPQPSAEGRDAEAKLVGDLATTLFANDPLLSRDDIVAAINREPSYAKRYGKLEVARYGYLGKHYDGFPELSAREPWMRYVGELAAKVLSKKPDLTRKELTAELQKINPRITSKRVEVLALARPGTIPTAGPNKGTSEQRAAGIKKDVARLLTANPTLGIRPMGRRIAKNYPGLSTVQLERLIARAKAAFFEAEPKATSDKRDPNIPLSYRKLLELVVLLAPPGCSLDELVALWNGELGRRGISYRGRATSLHRTYPELWAGVRRREAQLFAEYARAAPRGATHDEILAQIRHDYPTFSATRIDFWTKDWQRARADYPELAPFWSKSGSLALRGLGEPIEAPRFLGGYDPERALAALGENEVRALTETLQYTKVTESLPLLDYVVREQKPTALQRRNVLVISHLLGTTVAQMNALRRLGASTPRTVMVGTPYGSNPVVGETLRQMGYDVRVPKLDVEDYKAQVEKALDKMVELFRDNGDPVLVLDDGGLVAQLLNSKKKYAEVVSAFKVVEQTTGGILLAEKVALGHPLVNVARSACKKHEGRLIGRVVAAKMTQGLQRLGKRIDGARAVVMGYGIVGSALAKELTLRGAHVTVIDSNPIARERAKGDGFASAASKTPLATADIVIGATGVTSIELEDMRKMKSGVVLASASSKRVELAAEELQKTAKSRHLHAQANVRLPTCTYELGGKKITLLGDGWPVNFDGDVDCAPPAEIQLTRAIMVGGALQASNLHGAIRHGLASFDPVLDRALLEEFRRISTAPREIENPDERPSELLALSKRLAEAARHLDG